jgi:hypothetical protein
MKVFLLICFCFVLSFSAGVVHAQDVFSDYQGFVHRPLPDCSLSAVCIPRVGDIYVTVGELIEIDVSRGVFPDAPEVEITLGDTGVIRRSALGNRIMDPGPDFTGSSTIGCFFQAFKPGTEVITITVDGQQFEYPVIVSKRTRNTR